MKVLPVQTPTMTSKVLLVVMALAAVAWPADVASQAVNATVLSIGDGDTIRVRQADKAITVRLACIDAPETAQSPYGQQARTYLQQRLPIGREVSLNVKTTDRYGRTVAEVFSGVNINLALVEDGQAFAYRQYLSSCSEQKYLEAETKANRRRIGVWHVPGGITRPWEFRRGRSATVLSDGTTPGGRRYRCTEIDSYARAQELLRQGHTYLDSNRDGAACESLR
jgi:endonuclease YncB( thermonuclease family)